MRHHWMEVRGLGMAMYLYYYVIVIYKFFVIFIVIPLGVPKPPALRAVAVGQVYIVGLGCQHLIGCDHNVVTPLKYAFGETSKDLLICLSDPEIVSGSLNSPFSAL